jgi:hypothetical protein
LGLSFRFPSTTAAVAAGLSGGSDECLFQEVAGALLDLPLFLNGLRSVLIVLGDLAITLDSAKRFVDTS